MSRVDGVAGSAALSLCRASEDSVRRGQRINHPPSGSCSDPKITCRLAVHFASAANFMLMLLTY